MPKWKQFFSNPLTVIPAINHIVENVAHVLTNTRVRDDAAAPQSLPEVALQQAVALETAEVDQEAVFAAVEEMQELVSENSADAADADQSYSN
ncbi:MAG: hypothetical protein ACHP65_09945 [Legionellales bacterium]